MRWFEINARVKTSRLIGAASLAGRSPRVAPAWIGLAECDALYDDGQMYADKLREAGVPTEVQGGQACCTTSST